MTLKLTVVANNNNWTTLSDQLGTLNSWVKQYSNNRLQLVFDVIKTGFQNISFEVVGGNTQIQVNWYRNNITPLGTGHATLFLVNPDQWLVNGSGGTMTYGDAGRPVRIEVCAVENERDVFIQRAFHEICHALFFLTGQKDGYVENGVNKLVVHDYLYQDPPKYTQLLDLINYQTLEAKLLTIMPMSNQSKVVKSKTSNTVWICQPVPDMDYLNKKANLEGFTVPSVIPNSDAL